jgi:GTP-binding protein
LKHLARTRVLLHLVDVSSFAELDAVTSIKSIVSELKKFDPQLAKKPRWLVFNKIDLLSETEVEEKCRDVVKQLKWKGPVFKISAIKKQGTQELCYKLMEYLVEHVKM